MIALLIGAGILTYLFIGGVSAILGSKALDFDTDIFVYGWIAFFWPLILPIVAFIVLVCAFGALVEAVERKFW